MINIYEILNAKFPHAFAIFPPKILLQDDGNGIYIKEWNLEETEPTDTQLTAWAVELEDEIFNNKQRELRAAAYGTWQEQMDMQFHGTWQARIEEVKQQYPLRSVD